MFYANQHNVNLDTLEEQHKRKSKRKNRDDGDEEEEEEEEEEKNDKTLPVLGLSCFVYMILVEEYETYRLPHVYRYGFNLNPNSLDNKGS